MNLTTDTAAICGLFCGTCPSYPKDCGGCLSSRIAPGCDTCGNGFRDCAKSHEVTRCYECNEFPCARLESFRGQHVVNGIGHHTHVIDDLQSMKESGVEAWVAQQAEAHTCTHCGKLIPWHESACPGCRK